LLISGTIIQNYSLCFRFTRSNSDNKSLNQGKQNNTLIQNKDFQVNSVDVSGIAAREGINFTTISTDYENGEMHITKPLSIHV
ncbi:5570_t:CDS:1, partial [Funneliformis geosporum]